MNDTSAPIKLPHGGYGQDRPALSWLDRRRRAVHTVLVTALATLLTTLLTSSNPASAAAPSPAPTVSSTFPGSAARVQLANGTQLWVGAADPTTARQCSPRP